MTCPQCCPRCGFCPIHAVPSYPPLRDAEGRYYWGPAPPPGSVFWTEAIRRAEAATHAAHGTVPVEKDGR